MSQAIRHLSLLVVTAITISFAGCGPPEPVTTGLLHVDNTSPEPLTVYVQGEELETVEAGKIKVVTVPLGEYHIAVKGKDTVAINQKYKLEAKDPYKTPWLMLKTNPEHRYCRIEVVYGNDRVTKGLANGMTSMIIQACAQKAVGDDPEAQKKWIAQKERNSEMDSVTRMLHAFGEEPISSFWYTNYICKPLPEIVGGSRHSSSERRSVVIRIPVELYEEIEEVSSIEEPSDADIDRAYDLYDAAMNLVDSRPF